MTMFHPRTAIDIDEVFVQRDETLTVYLKKSDTDLTQVELRVTHDGDLEIYLDRKKIHNIVRDWESWYDMYRKEEK